MESHLLQMRGLKLKRRRACIIRRLAVASFTDAWIETEVIQRLYVFLPSHLLQMRGLKLINPEARKKALESHLLQMRGLKLSISETDISLFVASFTDAWIETS